ncbi:cyclic nucleotide-binding domain-containing protein [Listeria kieliensis]
MGVEKHPFSYRKKLYEYSALRKEKTIGVLASGCALIELYDQRGYWMPQKIIKPVTVFGIENLTETFQEENLMEYRVKGLEKGTFYRINKDYMQLLLATDPELQQFIQSQLINHLASVSSRYHYSQHSLYQKLILELYRIARDLELPMNEQVLVFPNYISISFLAGYLRAGRNRISEQLQQLAHEEILQSRKPIILNTQKFIDKLQENYLSF